MKNIAEKLELVVLSRDRGELIMKTIESLLGCTTIPKKIVISDNSESCEVAEKIIQKYPYLEVRRRLPTLSAVDHYSVVISEVQLEYCILFHDDDEMNPDYIETIYNLIELDKSLVAVATNAHVIKKNNIKKAFYMNQRDDVRIIYNSGELIKEYLRAYTGSHPPFPSYIYRTKYIKGEGLSKNEGGKHSDLTFLIKLCEKGKMAWIKKSLIKYRIHAENDSAVESISDRLSLLRYLKKNKPGDVSKIDALEYMCAYNLRRFKQLLNDGKLEISSAVVGLAYAMILILLRPQILLRIKAMG